MKQVLRQNLLWIALLAVCPLSAGELLQPEPLTQALKEYVQCVKTGVPNDKNHVIWKLYVYEPIYPESGSPDRILCGLSPYPHDHAYVMLWINLLWDSLNKVPQSGDVILVEGHLEDRDRNTMIWRMDESTGEKEHFPLSFLTLFSEKAAFDLDPTPTVQPAKPSRTPTIAPSPTAAVLSTPTPSIQTAAHP